MAVDKWTTGDTITESNINKRGIRRGTTAELDAILDADLTIGDLLFDTTLVKYKFVTVVVARAYENLSTLGTHPQWLPAGAWGKTDTNGAEFIEFELATNDIMLQTFNFDTTTSEKIQFWWQPHSAWDAGVITFVSYWTAASGSGTVIFSLAGTSFTDSDAIDAAIGGTPATTTDTLLTANDMHISPTSGAVTINGATKNEPVLLQISRDISDTLGVDAKLIGIKVNFTTDTPTA